MNELQIIAWNCRGLLGKNPSTAQKLNFFEKIISPGAFAIGAFFETHHRNYEDISQTILDFQAANYELIHTPTYLESHAGTIVLIRDDLQIISQEITIPGRMIKLHLKQTETEKEYFLTFYYGIQATPDTNTIEHYLKTLATGHDNKIDNMIIGDFNFVENDIDTGGERQLYSKRCTKIWEQYKETLGLTDPFREKHPDFKIYSYKTNHGKSRIDRMYCDAHNTDNIKKYQYIYNPYADHRLQYITIKHDLPKGPNYWKLNTTFLQDQKFRELVEKIYNNTKALNLPDIRQWWDIFLTNIKTDTILFAREKALRKKISRKTIETAIADLPNRYPTKNEQYQKQLETLEQHLKDLDSEKIQGIYIRTKLPNFEIKEPNIQHYQKLEKYTAKKGTIQKLKDSDGKIHETTEGIIDTTHKYYSTLYSKRKTDKRKQKQLLKLINKKATPDQQQELNAPITLNEIKIAIHQLPKNKSPGFDGIPIEFYQEFWTLLQHDIFLYLQECQEIGFTDKRNTGYIKLLYKGKGDKTYLKNQRPISLLPCDIKIYTKILTNRLKKILPTLIHKSQTAVDGRKIDTTIHLIRDLIQVAENEQLDAAFLFLDQEKAFDRVDQEFLFDILKTFGLGENFVKWLRTLYSNASSQVLVNGFRTPKFPNLSGVRQGDPLSPLLYITFIEILSLQLRNNPNIIGFVINGEKIVSMHYADDTTITITQNRCFKEVYKELELFEEASASKINWDKTKGLWAGNWKYRDDKPLFTNWTNKNVEILGIYIGHDEPARKTFNKIQIEMNSSIKYWKQFHFSKLAKSRIIEIFTASKLWYATKFHPIPENITSLIQKQFEDFIYWPKTHHNFRINELHKLRQDGGLKLIDVKAKSLAPKIKWLTQLLENPDLKINQLLMNCFIITTKGHRFGKNVLYADKKYKNHIQSIRSPFYKEAILKFLELDTSENNANPKEINIFYNPQFLTSELEPLPITQYCQRNNKYLYADFLDEKNKQRNGEPFDHSMVRVFDKIEHISLNEEESSLITGREEVKFSELTEKIIYRELINTHYTSHFSETDWLHILPETAIVWQEIWRTCHNPMSTEQTKTQIWEQIHLAFTQAQFFSNPNLQTHCKICGQEPTHKAHIILECQFTRNVWQTLEPHLQTIVQTPVTQHEMAFGLSANNIPTRLRNWLTFILRQNIMVQHGIAFHQPHIDNSSDLVKRFNRQVRKEIFFHYYQALSTQKFPKFKATFMVEETGVVQLNTSNKILRTLQIS